jgi:hypothetical protein
VKENGTMGTTILQSIATLPLTHNQPLILLKKASWTWELSYPQIRWWIWEETKICETRINCVILEMVSLKGDEVMPQY